MQIFYRRSSAFTLLELVIVIIIVGVLSSLALPRLMSVVEGARVSEAVATIGTIRSAMERCALMHDNSYMHCAGVNEGDDLYVVGTGTSGQDNTSYWTGNILGIGDPSTAPGSHFFYELFASPEISDAYAVCARRKGDVDEVFSPSGSDTGACYFVCMGYGVKPTVQGEGDLADASNPGDCWVELDFIGDKNLYWTGEKRVSGFLPK